MTRPHLPPQGDWQEFKLGDLMKFSNGINADKSAYGSGTPFANVLEIINNESLEAGDIPGRINLPQKVLTRYEVRRGDFLFNRTSETQEEVGLASVYLGRQPIVFGGFVFRGRPLTNDLDLDYSKYALRTAKVRDQIMARGQGGIRANIGQGDLKTVLVTLPPLPEQQVIAEALDDASRQVKLLERLIAKKQAMKRGMMQQLLTGCTRLPGFQDPWSSTTLGTLGTFLKGRGVKRDDVRMAGIPCIRYGELYTKFNDYTSTARSFVTPVVAATALPLQSGDLLFTGSGETREEIGKCVAYLGETPAVAGGDLIILRGSGFNPVYVALLANTPAVANQKARAGQGDAVVHISSSALAEIRINLPGKDEQDKIASVVLDADCELGSLHQRLDKARAVRQGMMQQLLTGRTRLPVPEATL